MLFECFDFSFTYILVYSSFICFDFYIFVLRACCWFIFWNEYFQFSANNKFINVKTLNIFPFKYFSFDLIFVEYSYLRWYKIHLFFLFFYSIHSNFINFLISKIYKQHFDFRWIYHYFYIIIVPEILIIYFNY